ncbi:unnamed protein product [Chondrus crispus]|uniref:Uncharacterized protein n=1 Tax=Chondrus crispus TaxID=2769 RepID=R7QBW2_CHOCR|nr:unnamed protein product [Chondrus crispus]CDF35544.1 unnamed protein product [Chondrus crispus]|eukprot:XP_005715363.1 unnamed protein product [Chondrus crispus]
MDSCSKQDDTITACCLQNRSPTVCPVLSCHSEKPILKLKPTSIYSFYKDDRFDGRKHAKEWVAALTVVHHLSTKATLSALRNPRKLKPLAFSAEEDFFLIWWPRPKPRSLKHFLLELHFASKMSTEVQFKFLQILPHHTGFYRCAMYRNELYFDDESDVPYPTEQVQELARRDRFTNCTDRMQEFVRRPTVLTLDLSRDKRKLAV